MTLHPVAAARLILLDADAAEVGRRQRLNHLAMLKLEVARLAHSLRVDGLDAAGDEVAEASRALTRAITILESV